MLYYEMTTDMTQYRGIEMKTVCFIGHRKIAVTPELEAKLSSWLLSVIQNGADTFLFGDHSDFDTLCYEMVTALKQDFPHIRRVHYRKDHAELDEYSKRFFCAGYEESICPKGVERAGRAAYVERNRAMIRDSDVCVFYYDSDYQPTGRKRSDGRTQPKSGTGRAYRYAVEREESGRLCGRSWAKLLNARQ